MDRKWQQIFRNATDVHTEPTDSDLVTMIILQELACSHKEISDLEPLRHLTKLQELRCSSNKISDLEPLRPLINLHVLDCGSNKISDLEPLRPLINLQELDCSSNNFSDLYPLRLLNNLQELMCFGNEISDLEPLRELTNLQKLRCFGNEIGWWHLLKFKFAMSNCKVMCLVYNARPSTKDVDAIFEPVAKIREVIQKVAETNNLSEDWLNDSVKGFVVNHNQRILFNWSNLNIYVQKHDYLLAMNTLASRVDTMDKKDVQFLIKKMGIKTAETVFKILEEYYPRKQIKPATQFFIEELFEK